MEKFSEFLYNEKEPMTANEYYVAGLNYVIEGNDQRAIASFVKCVKRDTNIIDAYYRLARLYDAGGEYKKAQRILLDLLLRTSMPKKLVQKIEDALISVYQKSSQISEALTLVQKKSQQYPKDFRYKDILSSIYEKQESWEEALKTYEEFSKLSDTSDLQRETRLKVALCKYNYSQKTPAQSVIKQLKVILKDEQSIASAYELMLEIYHQEQDKKRVVETWKQYLVHIPIAAATRIKFMEESLYELGCFEEIEGILEYATKNKTPDALHIHVALIELYRKKGENNRVEPMLEQSLKITNKSSVHLKILLKVIEKTGLAQRWIKKINDTFLGEQ